MTTRRSLNKLEFKAHMNIHNSVDISGSEAGETRSTRDRFGKKHDLTAALGKQRSRSAEKTVLSLLFFQVFCFSAQAGEPGAHPRTNIQVVSSDQELFSLDKKLNPPDDKAVFFQDGSAKVGINEDGDPSVSTQF